nr:MAG TPA: hypothetical protein [Caudoviricetes sp.]
MNFFHSKYYKSLFLGGSVPSAVRRSIFFIFRFFCIGGSKTVFLRRTDSLPALNMPTSLLPGCFLPGRLVSAVVLPALMRMQARMQGRLIRIRTMQ